MKIVLYCVFSFITMGYCFGQNYTDSISNYETYTRLKGKPLSNKFSNIESVKVIYDIKNKKLYYFNSSLIRLHFEFVTTYLDYDKGLEKFNADNYSNHLKNREFFLGNLNHIKGTQKWVFELAASDDMPVPIIETFFEIITKSCYIGQELKFYLNTSDRIEAYDQGKFKIPCIKSDYIFNELQYQEVVSGKCIGLLRYYQTSKLATIQPKSDEIIILDATPENLPNVRGIIVNELQTPLSHLVILGKNRKIPIMALTTVNENRIIQHLINKKVALKIVADTFYLTETNKKVIPKSSLKKRKLKADYSVKQLVNLTKIPKNGVDYIGAKAQNMAYLIAIAKETSFKTPENAWAIPFYFYAQHTQKKPIQLLLEQLTAYPHKDSINWINKQLHKIRSAIKQEAVDPVLLDKLNEKLGRQDAYKNFRFRSSTNAEDSEGFNGAGLYDSKTGILNDSLKSFEKAIQQVWASVWNESSYWERELFEIDQKSVAMGILVHRAFPDELANGVVITKNLYRDNFTGITVNVQKGENSVVKPKKGELCDQFTVYDFNLYDKDNVDFDIDYVSNSNLNENRPVLTQKEINNLYRVSKNIEQKMYRYWGKIKYHPVDIEFKIVGQNRELYIKQVRPFTE